MEEKLSYRMLRIGGAPAGLLGLNELYAELFNLGFNPEDPALAGALVEGVRKNNYIPRPALQDYKEALQRDYTEYYAQKTNDDTFQAKTYGTWRGYPREHIPWFPTVAGELCNGCDRCIEFCSYGVYRKQPDGKVDVVEPFLCLVGCNSCASVCEPEAILFPSRKMLNDYRPIG